MSVTLEADQKSEYLALKDPEPGQFDVSAQKAAFEELAGNNFSHLAVESSQSEKPTQTEQPRMERIPAATDTVTQLINQLENNKENGLFDQYRIRYDSKSFQVELLNQDKHSGNLVPWKDANGQPYTKETAPPQLLPFFEKVEQVTDWLKAGKNPELMKALEPHLYEKSPVIRFGKQVWKWVTSLRKLEEPAAKQVEALPNDQKEIALSQAEQEIAIGQQRILERGEENQTKAESILSGTESLLRLQLATQRATQRAETIMKSTLTEGSGSHHFGRVEPYMQPYFTALQTSHREILDAAGDVEIMRDVVERQMKANAERIAELSNVIEWVEKADANRERTQSSTVQTETQEKNQLVEDNRKLEQNYVSLLTMVQQTNEQMQRMSEQLARLQPQAATPVTSEQLPTAA